MRIQASSLDANTVSMASIDPIQRNNQLHSAREEAGQSHQGAHLEARSTPHLANEGAQEDLVRQGTEAERAQLLSKPHADVEDKSQLSRPVVQNQD